MIIEDYVVLDFETANDSRASACSVALVKFHNGKPIDEFYSLINPETYFDPFNISLHGINNEMVSDKPNYSGLYAKISKFIGNSVVVAHNAPFDTSIILAENSRYNLSNFEFDYFDTLYLSRFTLNLLSNKLDNVAKTLGYSEFHHHNALADCYACGYIVEQLAIKTNSNNLSELINSAGYRKFGHVGLSGRTGFIRYHTHSNNTSTNYTQIIKDLILPDINTLDQDHPFFGKTLVVTGKLKSMLKREAWQKAVNVGAIINKDVTSKTNILIVGEQDPRIVGNDMKSNKLEKAEKLLQAGKDIQLITESDFLKMI